ncbi:MAG: ATP-binding protein [Acidobacteria bacterium]|nr:ATP-binding protein [Acidobacteriota bacterium]
MIIVLRGVPGSGKSTLARAIAPALKAVVLDKDAVRACLFPGDTVEYTTAQDDFIIDLMLRAARYHLSERPSRPIILDGRVFGVLGQVETIRLFAASVESRFHVIECHCSPETALRRIEADLAAGTHLARNRDAKLLESQLAKWEQLPYPVTRIDTELPLERCVALTLAALLAFQLHP